jgi:hypothetical protein
MFESQTSQLSGHQHFAVRHNHWSLDWLGDSHTTVREYADQFTDQLPTHAHARSHTHRTDRIPAVVRARCTRMHCYISALVGETRLIGGIHQRRGPTI